MNKEIIINGGIDIPQTDYTVDRWANPKRKRKKLKLKKGDIYTNDHGLSVMYPNYCKIEILKVKGDEFKYKSWELGKLRTKESSWCPISILENDIYYERLKKVRERNDDN